MTEAANGASRPTPVPATSSVRPLSSSTRVCRRTSTMNRTATKTAYSTVSLVIASSPTLRTSRIGPYSATIAGLPFRPSAARTRPASPG
jgi:hypothetical protein